MTKDIFEKMELLAEAKLDEVFNIAFEVEIFVEKLRHFEVSRPGRDLVAIDQANIIIRWREGGHRLQVAAEKELPEVLEDQVVKGR